LGNTAGPNTSVTLAKVGDVAKIPKNGNLKLCLKYALQNVCLQSLVFSICRVSTFAKQINKWKDL